MKALSLTQPWASAVVLDEKLIETRSWRVGYRGTLAIHASARSPHVRNTENGPVFSDDVPRLITPRPAVPTGAIIGLCVLYDCRPTEDVRDTLDRGREEMQWGDYSDGRWAWLLHGAFELPKPIPCRGALGLWCPPDDIARQVVEQLSVAQCNFYLLNSVE